MGSSYFDCVCCGSTDIGEEGDAALCDACLLCDCGEEGDDPSCRELLVDGSAGIYVPQEFAKSCEPKAWGIDAEAIAILSAGPEHDLYWETWGDVDGYVERSFDGKRWVLEQDGDLWAKCVGKAEKGEG